MRPSRAQLASEVEAFADKIADRDPRWLYAYSACAHRFKWPRTGRIEVGFYEKSARAVGRILALDAAAVQRRLAYIKTCGTVDAAWEALKADCRHTTPIGFEVPTLERWNLGHVYFARLRKQPQIVKIGFSRRLHDRLEDIEASTQSSFGEVAVRVGTMADEYLWHRKLRDHQIDGEWFFDPAMAACELPPFLTKQAEAA